jgi:hypothetical protein
MKAFLLSILLIVTLGAAAQQPLNVRLKHELDSLYRLDQLYREAMFSENKQHLLDSLATAQHFSVAQVQQHLAGWMITTDSSDLRRVRAIIRRYGYPGKKLVGTPTNEAAFYVLQHSNSIAQYLPLVKRAAEQGELPFRLYAMMLDRQLMYTGKPQVYGTQGRNYNGQAYFIWPIEDPTHVNERRKTAGFEQTVEQNAQRLDIKYQVLTLDDVRKMPGYQPPAP